MRLWIDFYECGSDFSEKLLILSNTVEKMNIINLSSNSSKSYASVVLSYFDAAFLWKGSTQPFFYFYILFC